MSRAARDKGRRGPIDHLARQEQNDQGVTGDKFTQGARGGTSRTVVPGTQPARSDAADAGALVRAKILETMKRGISESRTRTDLATGDKKMLEHMKMYVMETKLAEMDLSEVSSRLRVSKAHSEDLFRMFEFVWKRDLG